MSEFHDLSRLPVESTYWDDLEAKIMSELGPHIRNAADSPPVWWAPLAEHAWGLGGFAIAATLAALLLVPARTRHPVSNPAGLLRLPNDNPTLTAFVSSPAPPPLSWLVLPRNGSDQ